MSITIKNIKEAYKSNYDEEKIIKFLERQNSFYGLEINDCIASRQNKLKNTEEFLKSAKEYLNVDLTILVELLNRDLPKGYRARLAQPLFDNSSKYAVVNISNPNGKLKQYMLAPIVTIDKDISINLIDALPSSLNPNYSAIFDDFPTIIETFYLALAETIRKRKQFKEESLIARLTKIVDKNKNRNSKKVAKLNKEISIVQNERQQLNQTPNDNLKIN